MIRAAGGIVVRGDEVLIVHRPKYDDWSLPKGKCKRDESDEACALREVEEETGYACEIVRPLGESRYRVLGRPKVVRWFLMQPLDGAFTPGPEVDEIAWVPRDVARERITFDAGAELVDDVDV